MSIAGRQIGRSPDVTGPPPPGNGGRMDRLARRMDRLEEKIDDLAKTTNTMNGMISMWKFVVPSAILITGVLGTLLGLLLP